MSRYMLIMRSTPEAEKAMEEQNIDFNEIIESMGRYNEELIKAGVMLAGEGLTGPDEGFVVDFNDDPPVVTDGPYTQAKERLNGLWTMDVSSKEEAANGSYARWDSRQAGGSTRQRDRRISSGQRMGPEGDPVEGRPRREDRGRGTGRRREGRAALSFGDRSSSFCNTF
jgi:hypothetical protein